MSLYRLVYTCKKNDMWTVGATLQIISSKHKLLIIRKTCPCNGYSLKPHFYIEKTGFWSGLPISLIFASKHRLWVLVSEAVLTFTHIPCFEQK